MPGKLAWSMMILQRIRNQPLETFMKGNEMSNIQQCNPRYVLGKQSSLQQNEADGPDLIRELHVRVARAMLCSTHHPNFDGAQPGLRGRATLRTESVLKIRALSRQSFRHVRYSSSWWLESLPQRPPVVWARPDEFDRRATSLLQDKLRDAR